MKRFALAAVTAQGIQAAVSFVLQILVLRLLGVSDYGRFAILYGVIVLAMAVISGLVGDSLVVLHREQHRIRAALELMTLWTSLGAAIISAGIALLTGFVDAVEAAVFGLALLLFSVMEVVRRLLVAHLRFLRAAMGDVIGLVCALAVVLPFWHGSGLALWTFLAAMAVGQAVAILVGWRMLPREERSLVRPGSPDLGAVWRYGSWRALQQTLRPGLFTVVRMLVQAFAGIAAVGLLEAARTYVSPLTLVVGSFSSLLFVRFAERAKAGGRGSLREADRVVLLLLLLSVVLGGVALVLAPVVGPLVFDIHLDQVSVISWVAYGMSIAMVTPYGALSAVSGRQMVVFLIRLGDTVLGIVLTALALALGAPFEVAPFLLAIASLLGGIGLRIVAARGEAESQGT
ncbi:lipopolysaccharide biosynthesis protein [Microbacterium sp. NPDC057659]|uniref:lipopolysaccharide biosynthesis protein n=1 Tax=Microbacterium sp. NPDC057659 TaxID=3346198 RepID=UPI003670A2E9